MALVLMTQLLVGSPQWALTTAAWAVAAAAVTVKLHKMHLASLMFSSPGMVPYGHGALASNGGSQALEHQQQAWQVCDGPLDVCIRNTCAGCL